MDNLVRYFQSLGFTAEEAITLASAFHPKEINKGEFFVEADKISRSLAFLESGQLQYYFLDDNGEERTTYISLPNTFVTSLLSFLNETPANENIRALAYSKIWTISKDDLMHLKNENAKFKDFYISLLEWQICCIDKDRFDLITLTAEQRYEKLIKEEPALLQQVPLQYIASMLGITPRHLSRLRTKI
jgi:CRP/FNR family transcriptional regulator, anaerobic regulatory protein